MMASISNTAMMMNTISSPSAASDQLRIRSSSDVMLRSLVRTRWNSRSRSVSVSAKLWKRKFEYPWPKNADPNAEGGVLRQLSHFKPLKEKPKPVTLKFERPLLDLKKKIEDVRKMANETDLDFTDQIALLESKYEQALKDLYLHLTPIQRLNIARHPNRPTFLDHIFNITEKFIELHGDRAGYDDPAIVTGIGQIEGVTYVFIGHQKGRNTKENIKRNHGMPTPHGYRKALRMMLFADRKGYPIVTFVDTPGAFADLKCEELGQGESIARNLFEMAGLKVPIISIVIGEGGSGGALAIACSNKLLMLENAVFYVASPEACAAILWKTAKAAPKAAEKLKITATELSKLEICDGIIPEPLGGAHNDPAWTSQKIKEAILDSMAELGKMDEEELVEHRWYKFRKLGGYEEGTPTDLKEKLTKKKTAGTFTTSIQELESEIKKLEEHVLTASDTPTEASISNADKLIEKLQKETDAEFEQAVAALGFKDRLKSTYGELAKARVSQDQAVVRAAQDKFAKFKDEMNQHLTAAPNYATLEKKASMLRDASKLRDLLLEQIKATPLKEEVNKKLKGFMERADVKERIEKVKAEVVESGATSLDDLDQELADRVLQLEKEITSELKEFNLNVRLIRRSEASKLMRNVEDVDGEIQEKIEEVASSSEDLKKKIDLLKSEVAKAGENPDAELRNKIQALQQEVMEDLYEALGSSDLAKLDVHETETSQTTVSSENGGMNGGVGGGVNGVIDGGGDGGVSSSRPETTVEA